MKIVKIFNVNGFIESHRKKLNQLNRLDSESYNGLETAFISNPNPPNTIFKTPFNSDIYPDIKGSNGELRDGGRIGSFSSCCPR